MTLGQSEADYLSATPRMLVAALERHRTEREITEKLHDNRTGTIAAAIYNAKGVTMEGGGAKTWRARDFFASLVPPARVVDPAAAILAAVEACNTALGGRDLRKRAG